MASAEFTHVRAGVMDEGGKWRGVVQVGESERMVLSAAFDTEDEAWGQVTFAREVVQAVFEACGVQFTHMPADALKQ